jgi:thioredoxin 1
MGYAPFLGQVRLAGSSYEKRRPFLAKSRPRLAAAGPQVLKDATFDQALSAPKAVVDIWSPSCPVCVSYKPIFEEVAAQTGSDVLMAEVLADENPKTASTYKISGIPATIFLVNGKEVHRVEGGMTKAELIAEMARAFRGGAMAPTGSVTSSVPAPTPVAPSTSGLSTGAVVAGGLSLAVVAGAIYLLTK